MMRPRELLLMSLFMLFSIFYNLGQTFVLHGEDCDPIKDVHLYPFGNDSDKFFYCDKSKKVFMVAHCPTGSKFDELYQQCMSKQDDGFYSFTDEETAEVTQTSTESTATTMTTNSTYIYSTAIMPLTLTTVVPKIVIFKEAKKNATKDMPKNGQTLTNLELNDSTDFGTALKVESPSDSMRKHQDIVSPQIPNEPESKKTRSRGMEPLNDFHDEHEANDAFKATHKEVPVVPPNLDDAKGNQNGTTLPTNPNEKSPSLGDTKLFPIPDEKSTSLDKCKDGAMPLLENDGRVHRCLPDYGHNPLSTLACPLSYKCQQNNGLFQCCPRLLDANRPMVVPKMLQDYEEVEEMPNGHAEIDLREACPAGYSTKLHPLRGLPIICSPDWPLSSCPPYSRCQYSPKLRQFICCQPEDLRSALREMEEIRAMARQGRSHPQQPVGMPQAGILPGQPGCLSDFACNLHFPGAFCDALSWQCKCPLNFAAYDGKCVFQCPYGYFVRDGICTPTTFLL